MQFRKHASFKTATFLQKISVKVFGALNSEQRTVYSVQSTVCSVQRTVRSMQSTVYSLQHRVYSVQSYVCSLHTIVSEGYPSELFVEQPRLHRVC